MELTPEIVDPYVNSALREDIGSGDMTTEAVLERRGKVTARIVARQPGVVAGFLLVDRTFALLDSGSSTVSVKADGERVSPGETVIRVTAEARAVLAGERTALNFLQHLSGIATRVDAYMRAMGDKAPILLDTRKTTPGLRILEKYAVRIGGAQNHRMGLFDGVLIKENHQILAGGPEKAVRNARSRLKQKLPIEIEVHSLDDFDAAAGSGADILLLDNMSPEQIRLAVQRKPAKIQLEASGGIDTGNISGYASTGVERISAGGLIHAATWLDFSLMVDGWKKNPEPNAPIPGGN